MRFHVHAPVFGDQSNGIHLLGLLQRAVSARFFVTVADPAAEAYVMWLAGLNRHHREAWCRMVEWAEMETAVRPILTVHVAPLLSSQWSDKQIVLADALRLADTKFRILMENGRADRAFFLAMAPPDLRAYFLWLEDRDLVEFHGAGGIGELKKIIEKRVATRDDAALMYFSMFDRDAPRPGVVDRAAELAIDACVASGIEHVCLERRAIENYLPLGAVSDFVEMSPRGLRETRRRLFAEFCELSQDQRNHFRMKTGLPPTLNADEAILYGALSDDRKRRLAGGFSDDLAGRYETQDQDRLWSQILKDGARIELDPMYNHLIQALGVPYNA